jgi:hypothetical protein
MSKEGTVPQTIYMSFAWQQQSTCSATVFFAHDSITAPHLASNLRLGELQTRGVVVEWVMECAERWYYSYNTGLQNQSVVYSCEKPGERGEVFFDPNTLSADGTTALSGMAFSKDGAHLHCHHTQQHHRCPAPTLQPHVCKDCWDRYLVLCGSLPSAVMNACKSQSINCVDFSSAAGLKLNSAQVRPRGG